MSKTDRIKAVLAGEKVTNIPYSFWTHVPETDLYPEKIAQATYDIYKQYDLDFIKMMNNGMYSVEDYGPEIDYSKVATGGVTEVVKTPIETYEDWAKIGELSLDEGAMARELEHLKHLVELVDGEAPILFTVFSPLTTANKLSIGKVPEHIKQDDKGLLKQALENIAKTTAELSQKAIELGADGVFFATQLSAYDVLSEEEYKEYGVPYDTQALEGASEGWFNTLHVHGENIMFDLMKDYPVHVFNYHAWETYPEIGEAIDYVQKPVMSGIGRIDLKNDDRNVLRHQIYESIKQSDGKNLLLTVGCTVSHPFKEETVHYLRDVKEETERVLFGK